MKIGNENVVLSSGERLACDASNDDGVMTDAGLVRWDFVVGFESMVRRGDGGMVRCFVPAGNGERF